MFSEHNTAGEKNATLTGQFGVVFDENSDRKSNDYRDFIPFTKRSAFKMFPSPRKRNAGGFKFLPTVWFEERFRNFPLS